MNAMLDIGLDNVAGHNPDIRVTQRLNTLLDSCGLNDTWRIMKGDEKLFTWKRNKPRFIARRLYYIFLNDTAHSKCINSSIKPFTKSDQCSVEL